MIPAFERAAVENYGVVGRSLERLGLPRNDVPLRLTPGRLSRMFPGPDYSSSTDHESVD